MATSKTYDSRIVRIIELFETLKPDDVQRLGDYYHGEAYFKDPFNEVRGLAGVKAVFDHMFEALHEPRFVVHDVVVQGNQCFMTWDFLFHFKRQNHTLQTVHGATQFFLDDWGKITLHRDYWDAAEELYEKLPLVGGLMRWLKKRAQS